MSKTLTITKKKALEAVMSEPLQARAWFHFKNGLLLPEKVLKNAQNCPACAVGNVLRTCGVIKNIAANMGPRSYGSESDFNEIIRRTVCQKTEEIGSNGYSAIPSRYTTNQTDEYTKALETGDYLAALSMYFEWLWEQEFGPYIDSKTDVGTLYPSKLRTIRLALTDMIIAEFPTKFKIKVTDQI